MSFRLCKRKKKGLTLGGCRIPAPTQPLLCMVKKPGTLFKVSMCITAFASVSTCISVFASFQVKANKLLQQREKLMKIYNISFMASIKLEKIS